MARQPVQNRSRRTFEAFLEATEALLRDKSFDDISIAEIVLRAGSSTGSFYARFASKNDLLPALYERYHSDLPARLDRMRVSLETGKADLRQACVRLVGALVGFFEGRHNLMRAITLFARSQPDAVQAMIPDRRRIQSDLVDLLMTFANEMPSPDPKRAIRIGLFVATSAVREMVLFPSAPFSAVTGETPASMEKEIAALLYAYLSLGEQDQ